MQDTAVAALPQPSDRFQEDAPGNKTVVLSYPLWMRRFGGDVGLVGKPILMSGEKYTVIGVMPKGFQYPDRQSQVWVPLGLSAELLARRNSHFLYVAARLKPNQSLRQGQVDMNVIARDLAREFPASNDRVGITVVPLKEELLGHRGGAPRSRDMDSIAYECRII